MSNRRIKVDVSLSVWWLPHRKNKMMARFASLLFETPGGSLPPYIPPPPIPLTLAELTHTHLDSAFADAA